VISIIIPLYNKAEYIRATVDSVLGQTVTDWELLVIDNGSTDGSPDIVRTLDDPRIRLVSSPKRGANAARNYGRAQAAGDWLVFLDADDLLDADYLRAQLARSAEADLVICPYIEFRDGHPNEGHLRRAWPKAPCRQALLDSAIVYGAGPPHAYLVRREFLRPDLLWPEHLDQYMGEDTAFWFRVISEARVAYDDRPVALYRAGTQMGRFAAFSNPTDLFTGMHAILGENLRYLAGLGRAPTAGQAENLMRFYGSVYIQARDQQNRPIAAEALREARHWQDRYFQLCKHPSRSMWIRRWLGLPLFARLARHA
jgi:glycosyltransferase involved in cell wall biosynthesis